jgi:UDP-N-acetylglucosamine/UDP-N-acetylgalactosamine diphosphorylase
MLKASRVGCEVGSRRPELLSIEDLRQHFEDRGQGHVFRFWEDLDAQGRERLTRQAADIDLPALLDAFAAIRGARRQSRKLEPVAVEAVPESGGDERRWAGARVRGEALLAEGRVAVMVAAGGQATRMGFPGPKGAFPLGPVTGRTLFEQQAQKIRRLRARFDRPIPWYVMTSAATDSATRACFEKAGHFELPPDDVFFLRQNMVPSFDFAGKLVLAARDRIFESPDGHGGSLTALLDSGALGDMIRRGADTIFYYQVDNPLVDIGAAAFLGFHAESGAEVSCKVLRKREPSEKVGVVARVDDRVGVVEYTEIDDAQRNARDPSGELVYWAGNMAVHAFDCDFVRRVAMQAALQLPYHGSKKKIPTIDADGRPLQPEEPNGFKLERFVFDALAATDRVCVVEALRQDEYSPVKNAEGDESPRTARRDLVARYRAWLEGAGIELPPPGVAIEVDESRVGGSEDARALGIRRVAEAGDVIRVADGDEA